MKKIISFVSVILLVLFQANVSAFADSTIYSADDIAALEEILTYDENAQILDWNLDSPNTIEEVQWEIQDDGEYHIVSLDLSYSDISSTADLKNCIYLNYVSFCNSNIYAVILPKSITELTAQSFANCSSLVFVEINSSEITIGKQVFSGCVNLKTLLNSDAITYISSNAFNNCNQLTFYGNTESSYASNYADEKGIAYSVNNVVSALCYIGIMTDKSQDTVNLSDSATPYHTGYITTDYGTFYSDNNGLVEFQINLGSAQEITINGETSVARSAYIDILYENYNVNMPENAIGIIVCDYYDDNVINAKDFSVLINYEIGSNNTEEYCYDIDRDGNIGSNDTEYFQEFINASSNVYTSWK